MLEVPAKSILQKHQGGNNWFGLDYNMNLYRGCCHGCIYCDSRSECYGIDDFDTVRVKSHCIDILAKELKSKRKKGVIGMGSMSDPYNPFETAHEYTRKALAWVNHFNFGISMVTKSALIRRDADILSEINRHSPVIAKLTITCADDSLASLIEPNVSKSSERFAALKELSAAGIFSGVMLMPILPFITDNRENIEKIVCLAAENGAKFIYPAFGVTLRANQREHFYARLDSSFPGLKEEYIKRYGDSYACGSPKYKELKASFESQCRKYNILYKMDEIISAYKAPKDWNWL